MLIPLHVKIHVQRIKNVKHVSAFTPQLRDFPTRNGKTRADAQKACEDAFNHHATVQQCMSRVDIGYEGLIHECVEDFKVRLVFFFNLEKYIYQNHIFNRSCMISTDIYDLKCP